LKKTITTSGNRLSHLAVQFAGKAWSMLMALAFLPMYVDILGNQKFAIIGFYLVCQAVVSLLDTAITATVNKEVTEARLHSDKKLASSVRTLELICYSIACAILVFGVLFAPFLTRNLHIRTGVDLSECRIDSLLIVCAICMQGLFLFYLSSILALQKHHLYAGFRSLWFTGRFAGGVACLLLIGPSPSVFLGCHCVTTGVLAILLRHFLWQSVPQPSKMFIFENSIFARNFQFLSGVVGITATTVLLCQVDKLILFNIIDSADYTFYITVWSLAGGLRQLVEPLFSYVLPNFSAGTNREETNGIKDLFTLSMQLAVLIVAPIGITAIFFSDAILSYWLKDFALQWKHYATYVLLLIGMSLNAMALIPYGLQLARNDTFQLLKTNVLLVTLCLPTLVLFNSGHGILVASSLWVFENVVYALFTTPQTYQRAFQENYFTCFLRNQVFPVIVCFLSVWCLKGILAVFFEQQSLFGLILLSLIIWFVGLVCVVLCFPELLRKGIKAFRF